MRNMSFSMTTPQMYACTKTVTRRWGWSFLQPGDKVMAVEKAMGLKKGEKIQKIGPIEIVDVTRHRLGQLEYQPLYGQSEMDLEGFPDMDPHDFVQMLLKGGAATTTRGIQTADSMINRIQFRPLYKPLTNPGDRAG